MNTTAGYDRHPTLDQILERSEVAEVTLVGIVRACSEPHIWHLQTDQLSSERRNTGRTKDYSVTARGYCSLQEEVRPPPAWKNFTTAASVSLRVPNMNNTVQLHT